MHPCSSPTPKLFRERVQDAAKNAPTPTRWLVVAAEPVTSVDVTAADTLEELDKALHDTGIELCFAELKDPVKDKLKRFGLYAQLGESYFFPTVGSAVSHYLEVNNVEWEDWEAQEKVRA
jgi:MFS superfamily sulfate permease-like transporter